MLLQWFITWF